jgi:hypothetical protein
VEYTAVIEWRQGEEKIICRRQKKTSLLLRPWNTGPLSRRVFLQTSGNPIQQFQAFWDATKQYAESTKSDSLIHKSVAGAVNGLVDFLRMERKRVPGDVLRDADRLECLLFSGYDPHFEGDEPPNL